jgi:hypothetical protein
MLAAEADLFAEFEPGEAIPTKPSSVLRSLDIPTRIAKQHPRQLWSNLHRYIAEFASSDASQN